jgi:cell fate regulator YaaT (PSP1 superfamily)
MMGGLAVCGRKYCCAGFLTDFVQVSIKMAKEQNLSLNSTKISGCCGRLMCCLRYEVETYETETRLTPSVGSTVETGDGRGTVVASHPLKGTVTVKLADLPDEAPRVYHRDTVRVCKRERPEQKKGEPQERGEEGANGIVEDGQKDGE